MPPAGMPRPDAATYTALTSWLETELDRNALAHPNPGAPAVHRLNRAEYRNAVRDLLDLDLDHSANLPPDDSGYGFDNIGDVLTVSPLHMEKYLANARRIARLAIGTLKPSSALERFTPPRGTANDSIDALPLNERGGILIHRYFPFDAEYSILVRVRGNPGPGMPPAKLDLRVDGQRVKLYDADYRYRGGESRHPQFPASPAVPSGRARHRRGVSHRERQARRRRRGAARTAIPPQMAFSWTMSLSAGRMIPRVPATPRAANAFSPASPRRIAGNDVRAQDPDVSGAPGLSPARDRRGHRSADEAIRDRPHRWIELSRQASKWG